MQLCIATFNSYSYHRQFIKCPFCTLSGQQMMSLLFNIKTSCYCSGQPCCHQKWDVCVKYIQILLNHFEAVTLLLMIDFRQQLISWEFFHYSNRHISQKQTDMFSIWNMLNCCQLLFTLKVDGASYRGTILVVELWYENWCLVNLPAFNIIEIRFQSKCSENIKSFRAVIQLRL